jgi:hypothetical protein
MGVRVAVAVLLLAGLSVARADSLALRPAPRFSVGEAFPLIALPVIEDGRARSIADFRGQKVVLHVFASW